MSIRGIQDDLATFAAEREWDQFHTPKNLSMALSVEVAELMEIFQWLTPDESAAVMSGPSAAAVCDELADVTIYLLRLADVLGVDLEKAVAHKMERNARRYDAETSRGSVAKRDEKPR